MPLTAPPIDARTYDELREETLRRARVHNPDWTNFNASDPGVTLVELFAFMTENLLYRVNQIPDRNRRAFLSLLGVSLHSASAARGIVTFSNERGPLETMSFTAGLELSAGTVPFRTDAGLDVLPVEGRVFYKRRHAADDAVVQQYRDLYAPYAEPGQTSVDVALYETVALSVEDGGIDLVSDTADGSLWIALLARPTDKPPDAAVVQARAALAGRVLSLGVVPVVDEEIARLGPGATEIRTVNHLRYSIPNLPPGGLLPTGGNRKAAYRPLPSTESTNVLVDPGIVQLTLPDAAGLGLWQNLDPLESGAGDFPPPLEESALKDRLITWIRIEAGSSQLTGILWAGINAATVSQIVPIEDEALPDATGDPDQVVRLARRPVVPRSVRLVVASGDRVEAWTEIDDLALAGPEIPVADPLAPPGRTGGPRRDPNVFVVDPEAGELRFGDGDRGRRPAAGAFLRASYAVSDGKAGDVGPGAISRGAGLPPGVKVSNPIRTWGGADAETIVAGEKRIARYLQHGERLVTAADYTAIAKAIPEVDVGRVEVLPAFDPRLAPNAVGDAPGAVTLMVIPRLDRTRPDAPLPDKYFLDAICRFLEPRRLVTTELFIKGPVYVPVWASVGIETRSDRSISEIRDAVKAALVAFLSPLPRPEAAEAADLRIPAPAAALGPRPGPGGPRGMPSARPILVPPFAHAASGWPLAYPVRRLELDTYAGRVEGVAVINGLLLAGDDGVAVDRIELAGLELPRLVGISVVVGDPLPVAQLKGTPADLGRPFAVPLAPEDC
jgi:hypothetical protein